MNRRNFLSKLIGAAAVVTVAPQVLASIKPEPALNLTEGLIPFIRRTQNIHVYSTAGESPFSFYAEAEARSRMEFMKQMEQAMMFGKIERPEPFDKFYARANGIWSDQIEG